MRRGGAAYVRRLAGRFFLAPDGSNAQELISLVEAAITSVVGHQGTGPLYPNGPWPRERPARIPSDGIPARALLAQLPRYLRGGVKPHHPLLAKNILPLPSFMHIAAHAAVSLFMGNGVTAEDSGAALTAEIECAEALAALVGYEPGRAAGLFTFGGTATNLYAFKIGLVKADPESGRVGTNGQGVVVGSWPAHYSHRTAASWLGIGRDNYLAVPSNPDQTTNLTELEKTCRRAIEDGRRIVAIVGVGGSTSNMAVDDFAAIAEIRDNLLEDYGLSYRPHVHADTVIGWAYLVFAAYDLESNPLALTDATLSKLRTLIPLLRTIRHSDSAGVDFHKTGYVPYTSSMLLVKNGQDLALLRRDGTDMTPLFHDAGAYNPGVYTLETSRSTANMVATWLTLQSLGQDGLRRLLANALENSESVRRHLANYKDQGFAIVNDVSYGADTFVRCYPPSAWPNPEAEFASATLTGQINDYNSRFFAWLTDTANGWVDVFAVSKTSAARYTSDGRPIVALRVYSLNPHMGPDDARALVDHLRTAKAQFDRQHPSASGS